MNDTESARISALHSLDILDTPAEERFDRIARLASDLFDAPISLVSLVDRERQWFKAHHGVSRTETPRAWAFCDHAIREQPGSVFVVEDAARDARFRENPLVTGDPMIRFYAGAVLTDPSGANLGTLCIIDTKPRPEFDPKDLARLRLLADLVERELDLTRALRRAEEHQNLLDLAEQMSGVAHWRFDFKTQRFTGSTLAHQIHGMDPETLDTPFDSAIEFYDPDHREEIKALFAKALQTGQGYTFTGRIVRPDGVRRTVQIKTSCRFGPDHHVSSLVGIFQDVTDSIAVKQRAQDSERLARLLADNTSDVVTFVATDGRLTYLSSACERVTGYHPDEMIGTTATRFIHKDDWAKVAEAFARTLNGEVGRRVEYRLVRKDGESVWIEARPTLFRDPDTSEVIGVTDAMRDITDRKRAEAELAATNGRYAALFEALSTGVVVQDQTGAIIEANHSAARVLGLTREQLLGLRSVDPRWKAEREDGTPFPGEEHPAMVTLKTGRQVRRMPMRVTTPDGSFRWIEVSSDPLFEQDASQPSHVVCTFQDVTDVRQAQRELAARDRRFRRILQALPMPVYTTDTEGYLTFWNDAATAFWGREPELGKARWSGAYRILDETGRAIASDAGPMARTIASRKAVRGPHLVVVRPDGETAPHQAFPTPIFDDTGVLTGGVNVLVDISEHLDSEARQARLIEELEQRKADMASALEAAEDANRAKSAFLANMSHELRTPLNGVMGVAGALYMSDISAKHKEMARLISESANTLEGILSDILDWSKLEAGKVTVEVLEFAPKDTLSPLIDLMKMRAKEKGLDFGVEFTGPVNASYQGDPLRVKQVVANLLSNAIKFTAAGSVNIVVTVGDEREGDGQRSLVVAVQDTGVGFSDTERERLFDRFEQADASFTRRYGGTGLGLPIALALTGLMGGDLKVWSTKGEGSCFTMVVPLWEARARSAVDNPQAEPSADLPLKVLLAEDHPTNQKVVTMILEPFGAAVTVVDDGVKALAAFGAERFDLIIMDMQMPEMDGLTAIRRIRDLEQERDLVRTPIVVLSANAGDEHRASSAQVGADGHIAKPVTPQSLITGILEAIESSAGVETPVEDSVQSATLSPR